MARSPTGSTIGVEGNSQSSSGTGVFGFASSSIGTTCGVCGGATSNSGSGVSGFSSGGNGVYGGTDTGYAGYFNGKSYFSGNVGIGTTTPGVALEVRRNGTPSSDWQTGQLRISGASDPNMQLNLGYDTTANLAAIQAGQAFTGFKTLALNPQGGRVGIGTASPDQALSVNGNASKTGGASWLTFSDARLKNINGRFTKGLKAVMQLQPIRYQYRSNNALDIRPDGEHIGFSAQEVEKIIPEAVTKNEQGYRLVNNDPIVLAMLNAIKEQQLQIELLLERVRNQDSRMNVLKAIVCSHDRRAKNCRARK